MVAVLDLLDDGGELAGDLAMQALPEDLDAVGAARIANVGFF
jgi:hypothetical protein